MFQLFDLIMTSPVGMFLANVAVNIIYAALALSDCDECGFNDLGKLLFGGLVLAVLFGVTVSLLYRRRRDKDAASSQFVSITSTERKG